MRKVFFPLISFQFIFHSLSGQINFNLAKEIDSLCNEDQKWRGLMTRVDNCEIDTIGYDKVSRKITITDSLNFFSIKKIFQQHGYPGYNLVDTVSSHNFWLLVQHADRHLDFQDSVVSQMKIEMEKENASQSDYAYLVDRVMINKGELQIYGSQMKLNDSSTSFEPKPVVEPSLLNERRKSVGLPSIEEYIDLMNKHYYGSLKKQ